MSYPRGLLPTTKYDLVVGYRTADGAWVEWSVERGASVDAAAARRLVDGVLNAAARAVPCAAPEEAARLTGGM